MTISQDDPIARAVMAEVRKHLAAGSVADLAEDVEAIDSLDATANPGLKVKLDQLRREVERRVVHRATTVFEDQQQQPDRSGHGRATDIRSTSEPSVNRSASVSFQQVNITTTPAGPDEYMKQRTRFQMIEAEIASADEESLAALLAEIATLTMLPAVERAWMSDQLQAETRRRQRPADSPVDH